jgi:AcrR family transcriptional regulator
VPYDSAATRSRILDAAITEFAAYGLAGGRVDHIADAAPANKKQIYVHFGNKVGLFDAAVAYAIERLIAEVPITPNDLPGYTVAAYDAMTANPAVFRLAMWRQLERPVATPRERALYAEKLAALEEVRGGSTAEAAETIALLLALAQTWLIASPALDDASANTASRRAHIHKSAHRLFTTHRRDE